MNVKADLPQVIVNMHGAYRNIKKEGDDFKKIDKVIMHNNEPVNIINVMLVLKKIKCLIANNLCTDKDLTESLEYLSEVSGYSTLELIDRM